VAILLFLAVAAQPISADQLSFREGKLEVIGRYRELLDKQLLLYDTQVVFILEKEESGGFILGLTAGKDNVLITGEFIDSDRFRVESLKKAPNDVELFAEREKACTDSARELLALGKEALKRSRRFHDPDLYAYARTLLRKGFAARRRETPKEAVEARLAWVKEMMKYLNDRDWALREATDILRIKPGWEDAERFLKTLDCVKWRGKWLSREDFMRSQGFFLKDRKWVPVREILFAKARARCRKIKKSQTILRTHTDEYYRLRAEQGKLLPGMTRKEAVTAWGFPDEVWRVRKGDTVFDQWRYGDEYVYLVDDQVAIAPVEEEEDPHG